MSWAEQGRVPSLPSATVIALWSNVNFVSISNAAAVTELTKGIPITWRRMPSDLTLREAQESEALETVRLLLLSFAFRDTNAFLRFRLPITNWVTDEPLFGYRAQQVMQIYANAPREAVSPRDVALMWFTSRFYPPGTNGVYQVNLQLKALINAFCADESAIYLERRSTLPSALNFLVTKSPNNGYVELKAFVSFVPSPKAVLEKIGCLDCLVIKLHVRPVLDPPMPLYFGFYWEPDAQKWLPSDYAIPFAEPRKQDYGF